MQYFIDLEMDLLNDDDNFLIFAWNNEYPQPMILSKNKKNNVHPC